VKKRDSILLKNRLLKMASALVMCACLLFLTGINFVVYDGHTKSISIALQSAQDDASDERSPEKPVDEKSAAGSVNIQEEYVHEPRSIYIRSLIVDSKQYRLFDDASLAVVHFELISPPPDC
jgi:hypothetical protein